MVSSSVSVLLFAVLLLFSQRIEGGEEKKVEPITLQEAPTHPLDDNNLLDLDLLSDPDKRVAGTWEWTNHDQKTGSNASVKVKWTGLSMLFRQKHYPVVDHTFKDTSLTVKAIKWNVFPRLLRYPPKIYLLLKQDADNALAVLGSQPQSAPPQQPVIPPSQPEAVPTDNTVPNEQGTAKTELKQQ